MNEPPRFEVLGPLGRGGMGQVLRVRERGTGRELALKQVADASDDRSLAEQALKLAKRKPELAEKIQQWLDAHPTEGK